jgi:cytochrome c oxidase subunit 1
MTGKEYPNMLAKIQFWITFIGVNMIFFPQHFLGLQGMPRRYVDYTEGLAYWNWVSSWGYLVTLVGVFLFIAVMGITLSRKKTLGDNQWGEGANTLEWTISSPPPFHQFNELPRIK